MRNITTVVLKEIENRFNVNGLHITLLEDPHYCPQVIGLTNICLSELGFNELARKNSKAFLESAAFNKEFGLFYREVGVDGKIREPYFNSCKNSVAAFSFASLGLIEDANKLMNNLFNSPIYDSKTGLFNREFNSEDGKSNAEIYTQSNLWAALALIKLGRKDEARPIMRSLELIKFRSEKCLFMDKDCRYQNSPLNYFVDDQALAALAYLGLGDEDKARRIVQSTVSSKMYDEKTGLFNRSFSNDFVNSAKSTYKNSLMAFALGKLGFDQELQGVKRGLISHLYNEDKRLFIQTTKDERLLPDNSALAILALNYENSRHEVF